MKKLWLIAAIISLFTLSSCTIDFSLSDLFATTTTTNSGPIVPNQTTSTNDDYIYVTPDEVGDYEVIFECNNGTTISTSTNGLNKIDRPLDPEKLCSDFLYWALDSYGNYEFNFNDSVNENTTLYAIYDIDFAELTNEISLNTMLSTVRIEAAFYESRWATTYATSLGSGVIIAEDSNYYYVVTNNHVINVPSGYRYHEYTVVDSFLNEYEGTLLANEAEYDLALLRFQKVDELKVISISDDLPYLNEDIIAIGEPKGQANCITYGNVLRFNNFMPDPEYITESNVTFEVIIHDATIKNGSSGGALINTNLELIGINFASNYDTSGTIFKYAYAIPGQKVLEFLNKYITL